MRFNMTKREFNTIINKLSVRGKFSLKKIESLTNQQKSDIVYFIVRNRGPIVKELIPNGFDWNWLSCMGYLYETKGKEYTFVHNCGNTIR